MADSSESLPGLRDLKVWDKVPKRVSAIVALTMGGLWFIHAGLESVPEQTRFWLILAEVLVLLIGLLFCFCLLRDCEALRKCYLDRKELEEKLKVVAASHQTLREEIRRVREEAISEMQSGALPSLSVVTDVMNILTRLYFSLNSWRLER